MRGAAARKTILAAIDGGLAARPVLACARALATVLGADVVALHVQVNGVGTPRTLALRAGVPLRILRGDVATRLVQAGAADDVVALVIGARGIAVARRPLGATALAVATTVAKPVVVVSPDAEPRSAFKRVLVPLEGNLSTSLAPRSLIELAPDQGLDVVALHILGPDTIPQFMDQPQHEQSAWAREFLARYCRWGLDVVDFETRVGRREDLIADAAEECDCDLIAMGWSQAFTDGHAHVVRATLERTRLPVVLIPVPSPATVASVESTRIPTAVA
jgi:nucleotide-binding universal stress UspA family protein